MADDFDDLGAHRIEVDTEAFETASRNALTFVYQPKQNVLGTDVIVVEEPSLFLREDYNSPCPISKPFKHVVSIPKTDLAPSAGASPSIARGPV